MAEGIKLVDAAAVDELVAIVVGLDTGARIGDAFGIEASRVDLEKGKIEFWVEKSDVWHTVYLFPPTVEFLREFLTHHHPARLDRDLVRGGARFLMPPLGVPSGPEVDAAEHKSALTAADDVFGKLVKRAGIGERVTRPSGSRWRTRKDDEHEPKQGPYWCVKALSHPGLLPRLCPDLCPGQRSRLSAAPERINAHSPTHRAPARRVRFRFWPELRRLGESEGVCSCWNKGCAALRRTLESRRHFEPDDERGGPDQRHAQDYGRPRGKRRRAGRTGGGVAKRYLRGQRERDGELHAAIYLPQFPLRRVVRLAQQTHARCRHRPAA
jgi:hypothetical protein